MLEPRVYMLLKGLVSSRSHHKQNQVGLICLIGYSSQRPIQEPMGGLRELEKTNIFPLTRVARSDFSGVVGHEYEVKVEEGSHVHFLLSRHRLDLGKFTRSSLLPKLPRLCLVRSLSRNLLPEVEFRVRGLVHEAPGSRHVH